MMERVVLRRIGFLIPALLILVILSPALSRQSPRILAVGSTSPVVEAVKVQASSLTIHLNGFVNAWNSSTTSNPTITVNKGDTVTISLTSSDGIPHRFLLDMDNDGAADTADCITVDPCSANFPPDTSTSFTAGNPGTYTYFCTIHPATMHASFVILSPTSANGGGGRHPYEV